MSGPELEAVESFKRAFKRRAENKLWKPRWDLPSGCLACLQTQSRLAEVVDAMDDFERGHTDLEKLYTTIERVRVNVRDQSTYVEALDQLKASLELWHEVAIDLRTFEMRDEVDPNVLERLLRPNNMKMIERLRPDTIEELRLQLKSSIPETSLPTPVDTMEGNKELLQEVIRITMTNSMKFEAMLEQAGTRINGKDVVEAFHNAMTPITDDRDPRFPFQNRAALKTCYNFANALRTELFGAGHTIRSLQKSSETFKATSRDDFLSKASEANLTPGTILTFSNEPQIHATTVVVVTGDILVADVHPANPQPSLKKLGALYDEFVLQAGAVEEEIRQILQETYATPTIGILRPPT